MFKNSTKILCLSTLILSTMMVISSENWMSMWMGLEINMMSFIPMLKTKKNMKSSESMMMYFLIQSISSIMFLFSIMINPNTMMNKFHSNEIITIIMTASMMMKMGIAPMHMWFVNIINKISWNNCLILMTWQKLAPMSIISQISNNNYMINLCAIITSTTGAIGGINQTSIKKIMAFSSVNHLGWLLVSMKFNNETWMKYLLIYTMMMWMLTSNFKKNSIYMINQMNMNQKSFSEKIHITIMFLSLGGLPPFIGFLPKWMVIQTMIYEGSLMTMMILMFTSMITLFYYMRMMTSILLSNSTLSKWNLTKNTKTQNNYFMIMINMSLPMMMMMINMT